MERASTWLELRAQIPNALSIARIAMAILFPFVSPSWWLPLVLLALASEFFDGFLARRWHAVSLLGQALDPIADKLFIFATVLVLILRGRLTWFEFTLVALRDLVVAGGTLILILEEGKRIIPTLKPRWSGKVTTTFQFALLIWLYLWPDSARDLRVVTEVVSAVSAADYLYAVLHRRFDFAEVS